MKQTLTLKCPFCKRQKTHTTHAEIPREKFTCKGCNAEVEIKVIKHTEQVTVRSVEWMEA